MLPWRDIKATALTEHPQFTCVQEQAVLTLPLPGGGGSPRSRAWHGGCREGVLELRVVGEPSSWGLTA